MPLRGTVHTDRMRILVVDDDRAVRESLRRSLAFNEQYVVPFGVLRSVLVDIDGRAVLDQHAQIVDRRQADTTAATRTTVRPSRSGSISGLPRKAR